jgi:hypothetical protein
MDGKIRQLVYDLNLALFLCLACNICLLVWICVSARRTGGSAFRWIRQILDTLREWTQIKMQPPTEMMRISHLHYKRLGPHVQDSNKITRCHLKESKIFSSCDEVYELSIAVNGNPPTNLSSTGHAPSQSEPISVISSSSCGAPHGPGEDARRDEDVLCMICVERAPDAILVDCGHRHSSSHQTRDLLSWTPQTTSSRVRRSRLSRPR